MESHIKTSRVHRGLAWLFAVLTIMLLLLPLSTLMSDENLNGSDFGGMLVFPGGTFAVSLLHYLVGRGAMARKPWARVASMCIAVVMLFAIPLGTLIGMYLLANRTWSSVVPNAGNCKLRAGDVDEHTMP